MARKILFYTHAFSGGGAELVFARLAAAFAEAGDRVIFAADRSGPSPVNDESTGVRHVVLGDGHFTSARGLAALLVRERPDVSFSCLGAQNLKHLAAAAITGRRRRAVLGIHGFAAAEAKRLSLLSYRLAPLTTRLAAQTVCVSDVLLEDMVRTWGACRRKLRRIHNPLPARAGAAGWSPQTPPLVLALGRLESIKRFGDLVEAFSIGAPPDARLAILGEGPERERLLAIIARLGLASRVDLPGHVGDPSPWYRRASCLAVSSSSESFGLTVAEALAHGLPVIATACGGPAEVLCGLGTIVPVGDVPALASALSATLADPGDPGPRRVRAQAFALVNVHDAYVKLADTLT